MVRRVEVNDLLVFKPLKGKEIKSSEGRRVNGEEV